MKILVDENIPFVKEAFATLGEVQTLPGRQMNADTVKDAQILCVRSITRVNEELLRHNRVLRFAATATAGVDHIDQDYLRARGVFFASAPGSNSNSVSEFVTASLFRLHRQNKLDLRRLSLGVVGCGYVGSKVVLKARALGLHVLQNDPPLKRMTGSPDYLPLDALMDCDVLTLHVPLIKEGNDATLRFFNKERFNRMKKGAIFINASRGSVVDEAALREAVRSGHVAAAVLDVWEKEPTINMETLKMADQATPHIAGQSYDGKVNGTAMIYQACCGFLGLPVKWQAQMPQPPFPVIEKQIDPADPLTGIGQIVHTVYDIDDDDRRMRELLNQPPQEQGKFFDQLRKSYPKRREWSNTTLKLTGCDEKVRESLKNLGFKTAS